MPLRRRGRPTIPLGPLAWAQPIQWTYLLIWDSEGGAKWGFRTSWGRYGLAAQDRRAPPPRRRGRRRAAQAQHLLAGHGSPVGGPKARGFETILGITIRDIGYLEGAIQTGVLVVAVSGARDGAVGGINCVVDVPVRGRGEKSGRTIEVRTAWELTDAVAAPRLVTAYVRP